VSAARAGTPKLCIRQSRSAQNQHIPDRSILSPLGERLYRRRNARIGFGKLLALSPASGHVWPRFLRVDVASATQGFEYPWGANACSLHSVQLTWWLGRVSIPPSVLRRVRLPAARLLRLAVSGVASPPAPSAADRLGFELQCSHRLLLMDTRRE